MKKMDFKNWTENFSQAILSSALETSDNHIETFLADKLKNSVISLDEASLSIHHSGSPREYYQLLCVCLQEAKNCMYWYERSLEYEQVNLNNSHLIINQGQSMINVLESTLRVIKFQENLN
jgi:hypothetical protein